MKPRPHRPLGDLHDRRDLVVGVPLQVLEEDDLPVALLELLQRLLHLLLGLLALELLDAFRRVGLSLPTAGSTLLSSSVAWSDTMVRRFSRRKEIAWLNAIR